jgi:DNA-binding NtrC family response regulator
MRRVLIVDDNVALAENMAEIIDDAGVARSTLASSGEQALAIVAATRFDVMVTDMRMPVMSGAELIQRTRQIDPTLPIVVITALSVDAQLAEAEREGVLATLGKPVPIARLLELIARAERGRLAALVEDDVWLAESIVDVLREGGFATVVAHTLAEAEGLHGDLGVALIDLRVPGGADGAAIVQMTTRFPDLPVVVVTAYSGEIAVPPSLPVIAKPFDPRHLLDTVETLFTARARARPH